MAQFAALDPKVDSFRILTILGQQSEDGAVYCELEVKTLASQPSYEAVSYAWDDAPAVKTIEVNGEKVLVNQHLHNLLRTFRKSEPRPLWIDALCINMTDNQERNDQVNMMSYIYSRATKVLSYIGQPRKSFSQEELEMMRESEPFSWREDQCKDIAKSPYWTRRWTIQELVLAKDIRFHLGNGFFTMDTSYNALAAGEGLDAVRERLELIEANKKHRPSDLQRLEILLETFKHLKCRDTRDNIFSLIGLADDDAQATIEVDYDKPYYDIFIQLIEYFQAATPLQDRKTLFARNYDFGPWTETWLGWAAEVERPLRLVAFSHLVQNALGGLVDADATSATGSEEGEHVLARGVCVGEILHIGPTYGEFVSSWESTKKWKMTIEEVYKNHPKLVELRKADAKFSRSFLSWGEKDLKAIQDIESVTSYGYRISADDERIVRDASEANDGGLEPRRFLATRNLIGFVPPGARVGDRICSFWDTYLGFIVRQVADDRWMIVGRTTLSKEAMETIVGDESYTRALHYGTDKVDYTYYNWSEEEFTRKIKQEAAENMMMFKLDMATLQKLTA